MAPTANRTLDGHKLLLLLGVTGPPKSLLGTVFRPEWIAELKKLFPGLEIVTVRDAAWNTPSFQKQFPDEEWKDVTILVTGSALPTADIAPKLEYVQLQSAGANHVLDHPLIRETNVALCTASGVHGPQIAEWVVTTFLAFQHQITRYVDIQRQSRWQKLEEPVNDAVQQRVGILGYGAVGRQVARVLKAVGMDIYVCTLHPRLSPESRRDETYTPAGLGDPEGILPSKWFSAGDTEGLHDFLSSGLDLLVITIPLTRNTRGLISRNELTLLAKQKTFVSNVGRGEIIKTDDLIDALEDGVIRGAALDVTDPEPLPDGHRLWSTKNLFISPHVSGDSSAYAQRVYEVFKYNLVRLSEGRELTNKVNRNEGY
ncbi:D-isomer specific 2-hydroxyacid dehydrogenase [Trichoderma harzianum]|uniref:D-isomer specific 2-hydroxyacid dehydrogenase n=1 Tax=Trichoderma harzianum TaxID=5544 RepID=A0A0F9XMG7_TRIHA|nr:D-isomer specific 2-hydroxyacid dehydrogenase [Trichoderma harzianum]